MLYHKSIKVKYEDGDVREYDLNSLIQKKEDSQEFINYEYGSIEDFLEYEDDRKKGGKK